MRSERSNGSPRSTAPFRMLNIKVLSPMPSASATTASADTIGCRRASRTARRRLVMRSYTAGDRLRFQ